MRLRVALAAPLAAACLAAQVRERLSLRASAFGAAHSRNDPTPEEAEAIKGRRDDLRTVEGTRKDRAKDVLGKGDDQRVNLHPPENGTNVTEIHFEQELKEMRTMTNALAKDLTRLEGQAAERQTALLSWMLQYAATQDVIGETKTVAAATQPAHASLSRRKDQVQGALAKQTLLWETEKAELGARQAAEEARAKELEGCAELRKAKKPLGKCEVTGHGDAELREALRSDASFLKGAAARDPWHIKRLQSTAQELGSEEKELQGGVWYNRGARLQKNQEVMLDYADIMSSMEGYFDYRHTHTLAELSRQRDFACELEILPALFSYGLIDPFPDFSPVSLLVDESAILHSGMEQEREYYHREHEHLWRSAWMLRAALEDTQEPHKESDVQCETQYGKDWWTWAWCREAHMKLLRYFDDVPVYLEDRMSGLSEVHRDFQTHIASATSLAEAAEDPTVKAQIEKEVTQSKLYLQDVVQEMDNARHRLQEQRKFTTWLHQAQGIPDPKWLKANVTQVVHEKLLLVERQIKDLGVRSQEFQVKQGRRILDCVDRKCQLLQDYFYKGTSHTAIVNKLVYEAMTNPEGHLGNSSRLEGLMEHAKLPENARRIRRLQSQVRQQLAERWRP